MSYIFKAKLALEHKKIRRLPRIGNRQGYVKERAERGLPVAMFYKEGAKSVVFNVKASNGSRWF